MKESFSINLYVWQIRPVAFQTKIQTTPVEMISYSFCTGVIVLG